MDGKPRSLEMLLDKLGYVPQDDIMYEELTVEETIAFSAFWRLPRYFTEQQRQDVVDVTIEVLGLGKSRHKRIGGTKRRGLSGGERKRVSIAIELVAQPSVLILDEPTSGLDSTAALVLMKQLSEVARWGVAVVTVLHQPSGRVFDLLDDLILVHSGQPLFIGEANLALDFFASLGYDTASVLKEISPPEALLDIATGLIPPSKDVSIPLSTKFLGSKFHQNQKNVAVRRRAELDPFDKDSPDEDFQEECSSYFGFFRNYCLFHNGLIHRNRVTFKHHRSKPGLISQTSLWFVTLIKLSFRKGVVMETICVMSLGWAVGFVRTYNPTWNRKAITYFFISVSLSILAITGVVFEDDIMPVRRAVDSGVMMSSHEFAVVFHSSLKGWVVSQLFALSYFSYLFLHVPQGTPRTFLLFSIQVFHLLRVHALVAPRVHGGSWRGVVCVRDCRPQLECGLCLKFCLSYCLAHFFLLFPK